MATPLRHIVNELDKLPEAVLYGRVAAILGMMVEFAGIQRGLSIGDRCYIVARDNRRVPCEVVGFRNDRGLVMPFGALDGVGIGCRAEVAEHAAVVYPSEHWLGRVVNAMGEPVDGLGPLPNGRLPYPMRTQPPPAHTRRRVGGKLDFGVRALNAFLSTCRGQRMGVFAGSGVGKSIMMSMLARYALCDVSVIGLVGERGREVQEFIHDALGPEGLARSVVVVATSDESPLMRRQAAYLTLAVSEYFRDQDKDVVCMIDSVTRFAMAQREIGLSIGEPPASKGYTPTVFAELPKLLERAGPGSGQGTVTGLFSVLVDGDDHNEPIADATRGILDGHIVLERQIAERGRYPAINILRSVSRMMPHCNTPEENKIVLEARRLIAAYEDMAEMIRLGAYRRGSDATLDRAIALYPAFEAFLNQGKDEHTDMATGYVMLQQILDSVPA